MEFHNYIQPEKRLVVLQVAYDRLKLRIPKGNAREEIEDDLAAASRIPVTLVADDPKFEEIYKRLKDKFIRLDDPDSD